MAEGSVILLDRLLDYMHAPQALTLYRPWRHAVLADHSAKDLTGADLLDGLSLPEPRTPLLIVHADGWTRQALQTACSAGFA